MNVLLVLCGLVVGITACKKEQPAPAPVAPQTVSVPAPAPVPPGMEAENPAEKEGQP